ncbi:hypothetical protein FA15DRAFT_709596 [Coprinopsis marcescibilis]|uniref:Uncharacterized protein n=1 Tax=Coprinopsis marcescibilis TaxID=230819 RepID=A0A5C3KSH6_COPMA|nr:hypothetical protein FA15DRAFT_709596 [Coprinopsis marcescibilis]
MRTIRASRTAKHPPNPVNVLDISSLPGPPETLYAPPPRLLLTLTSPPPSPPRPLKKTTPQKRHSIEATKAEASTKRNVEGGCADNGYQVMWKRWSRLRSEIKEIEAGELKNPRGKAKTREEEPLFLDGDDDEGEHGHQEKDALQHPDVARRRHLPIPADDEDSGFDDLYADEDYVPLHTPFLRQLFSLCPSTTLSLRPSLHLPFDIRLRPLMSKTLSGTTAPPRLRVLYGVR